MSCFAPSAVPLRAQEKSAARAARTGEKAARKRQKEAEKRAEEQAWQRAVKFFEGFEDD